MAVTYSEAVEALTQWYNTNSGNVWNVINEYNLTPEQAYDLIPTPENIWSTGYGTVNYANGSIASWNNATQLPIVSGGNPLDSNAGLISQNQFQYPANTNYSGTGGSFNGSPGVTGGATGAVHVMSQVAVGVACAGLGINLGKIINQLAYDNGFNWLSWAGVNIESLNPETWDSITVDMSDTGFEGGLKRAFNAIFGINPDGTSQMYLDENILGYLAKYMDMIGVFSSGSITATYDDTGLQPINSGITLPITLYNPGIHVISRGPQSHHYNEWYFENADYACIFKNPNGQLSICAVSRESTIKRYWRQSSSGNWSTTGSTATTTLNGTPIYSITSNLLAGATFETPVPVNNLTSSIGNLNRQFGTIVYDGTVSDVPSIEGINDQQGATTPTFSGASTFDDYLQQLQQQYPDMFNNTITQNVAQPDGTVVQHIYVPVGTPTANGTSDNSPTTDESNSGQSQNDIIVNPTIAPENLLAGLLELLTNLFTSTTDPPTTTPDTGNGDSPPVVIPAGTANALYSIYNPSQAEINSFGAWLWSSNFVDQLLKLFNDPMQAIIGLHKVFAPPVISGVSTIKVGYLDSNVSSNVVGNQYTTVDCGSVNISEYFGNVFDYDPYTQIYIYLPFVGIEKLDTGDIMRGTVGVKYHVDVLTGACLAEINVTRDGFGGILYTFAGNCAVQYPISSGSYMGIVASLASIAGGVVGTIASGGALAPVAMGAVSGIMNAHTRVNHSGAFSGNAGAMGVKTPYLIITRPQTCLADDFPAFDGYPANKTTPLSACSGFVKCESCHIENVPATDAELSEIEMLLKGGIII